MIVGYYEKEDVSWTDRYLGDIKNGLLSFIHRNSKWSYCTKTWNLPDDKKYKG